MVKQLLLALCLLLLPQLAAAEATATLDRSITGEGESVQLTIQVDGGADDPDLSPLKQDFDILGQSQNSSYSLINGSMSRSKSWMIQLMPKRVGTFNIPAISLGHMQTKPLSLRVLPAQQQTNPKDRDIFLEVAAAPQDSYVQAQILFTVKLFRAINLAQAELSEPDLPHAIVQRLGDDSNYETVRDNRRFVVTERHYAIFPQQSGTLHIPSLTLSGQLITPSMTFFNQGGRVIRISSQPVDIEISPMPSTWPSNEAWLPSTEVTLTELQADPPISQLKVGEPITRTIEIKARGLTAEQLPPIFSSPADGRFKQYPDKPELITEHDAEGVIGIRREKIAMIPTQAGDLTLPEIRMPWWNLNTQKLQYAAILHRVIAVSPDPSLPSTTSTQSPSLPQPIEASPQKITEETPASVHLQPNDRPIRIWQGVAGFLAIGWLITGILFWHNRHNHTTVADEANIRQQRKQLSSTQRTLEQACRNHDAQATAHALTAWAHAMFTEEKVSHFGQLKGKSETLTQAIITLEAHLYSSQEASHWRGDHMWQAIKALKLKTAPSSPSPLKNLQ